MSYELPEKIKKLESYGTEEDGFRVRLNANESFMNLPEELLNKAVGAVRTIGFNRYPDPTAGEVCGKAGALYGYPARNIAAGNGSDELISVIIGAFARRGEAVLLSEPDFSMYRFYSEICELTCVPLEKDRRRPDVDAMIRMANEKKAAVVIFSNPCNPSGLGVMREDVRRLIRSVKSLVVVDEAYMDFWDQSIIGELSGLTNAVVLKTCSKAAGLAGIRLGFALGSEEIINGIRKVKSPYNVNAVTQAIGAAVLEERRYLEEAREAILRSRDSLQAALAALCARYPRQAEHLNTVTNFALIRCADADGLYEKLKKNGILVRKTMGDCLRVTAGSAEENAVFLETFEKLLSEGEPE